MATKMLLPETIGPLTPREAVIDAVSRCVNGLDQNDEALFRSALTPEAKFTIFGKTQDGLEAIVSETFSTISKLDTTHLVTNHRVHIDGTKARMTATCLAQHYRHGTGIQGDAPRLLSGAFYDIDLVQDGELWRITDWKMDAVWLEGDRSVMAP